MSEDTSIPTEWYFITPPQSVSWSKSGKSKVTDTYGTNNPYINYGSTGLRKLSLSDAMLEGFSDGKEVEGNIINLESCMRMIIDEGTGFTAPYCWNVFAGDKSYGTFIITSVNVEEKMRDMSGKATRATVSIDFQEVAPYQVTSGIDITSTAVVGDVNENYAAALEDSAATSQDAKIASSQSAAGTNSTGQTASEASGSSGETGAAPKSEAVAPTTDLR